MTVSDTIRLIVGAAAVAALAYAALCVGLYVLQRRIIFQADGIRPDPMTAGVPEVSERWLAASDGLSLLAWYVPPAADQPVVLFFHGNNGHIGHRATRLAALHAAGWGVLLLEYRGYGSNPGTPSEDGLAVDAEAGHAELRALGIPPGRIVIWGESLGTAVAIRLACDHQAAALVLEAPFTSMVEMAHRRHPYVPVDRLLKDRFDSIGRIGRVAMPVLIIHGAGDALVPVEMGARLHATATAPVREFHRIEAAGHIDLLQHDVLGIGMEFVRRQVRVIE